MEMVLAPIESGFHLADHTRIFAIKEAVQIGVGNVFVRDDSRAECVFTQLTASHLSSGLRGFFRMPSP